MKCLRCGKIVDENCIVCPNCGFQIGKNDSNDISYNPEWSDYEKSSFCAYCGARLEEKDAFCPKCGRKKDESNGGDWHKTEAIETNLHKKSKTQWLVAVAVLLVFCISGMLIFVKTRGPNFKKLYQTYCKTYWADVGLDGSYLYIDTNPQDKDDSGLAYPEAAEAIRNINDALGIPESVINEMGQTTFWDGKQTETFEKQKVSISWRYHPDKGLEVTYTKLK